jgi:hypothetical protein
MHLLLIACYLMTLDVIAPSIDRKLTSDTKRRGLDPRSGLLLVLIAVLSILTRPYPGIAASNDSRYYFIEALRELAPSRFANDLYFEFGSQNQYTLFSRILAPALSMWSVGATGLIFTVIGQLLWIGGLVHFSCALFKNREHAWLAVGLAIALPGLYGIFQYGEPFPSARLFSEALILFALGLFLRRRLTLAFALLPLAIAIHPLTALPGVAFIIIYLAFEKPLWWSVILAGAVLVGAFALVGIQPFANLGVSYDQEWFAIVKWRESFCLISSWTAQDFFFALNSTVLAIAALIFAEKQERRFLITVLVLGLGGVALTYIGGDLARNVFITEIQPWRFMWLLTLGANLCAARIALRGLQNPAGLNLVKVALVMACALLVSASFVRLMIFAATPLTIVASSFAIWHAKSRRQLRLLGCALLLIAIVAAYVTALFIGAALVSVMASWPGGVRHIEYALPFTLASVAVLYILAGEAPDWRRQAKVAWLLSVALLLTGSFAWDTRSQWNKYVESSSPLPDSLATLLPENATVYWESGLEMLWFHLRRSDFFSCDQGTGTIFFRGTAFAFERRYETFLPLQTSDYRESSCAPPAPFAKTKRTRAELAAVCNREPSLDYLVLEQPIEDVQSQTWKLPVRKDDLHTEDGKLTVTNIDRVHVYQCASFRS